MTNASAELTLARHRLGSPDEWLVAGTVRLAKEKELTRLRHQLSAERRALPWVKVPKQYVFDTQDEKKSLADLCDEEAS
jgi:predicted dithiol-disulfide oxidoreductase (DUF899 family)